MGSLGDISLGDIGRALARYRPVALTVLAILFALAVLPRPDRPDGLAGATGIEITTPSTSPPAANGAPSSASDAAVTDVPTTMADTGFAVSSGATSFPSFSSGSSFSSDAFPDGGGSGAPEPGSGSGSFGDITSGTSTVDTTKGPAEPVPLRIVGRLWAARTGGTPLAKQDVPAGTLPVAFRATDDKISYVKLAGDGTSLGFAVDATGTHETSGPIKLQACKVTKAWSDGEGIALQDAPTSDPNKCVEGTASASGIWLFDLTSFPDRTDEFGFAIKAGAGAGLEWQVALKP
jgi:hypothetical protein